MNDFFQVDSTDGEVEVESTRPFYDVIILTHTEGGEQGQTLKITYLWPKVIPLQQASLKIYYPNSYMKLDLT